MLIVYQFVKGVSAVMFILVPVCVDVMYRIVIIRAENMRLFTWRNSTRVLKLTDLLRLNI